MEYADGRCKGSVYYPAEDDGDGQPFNKRLASVGRVPIVVMAHGNHDAGRPELPRLRLLPADTRQDGDRSPSRSTATRSTAWAAACQNIEDRADLIIDSIKHFQGLRRRPGFDLLRAHRLRPPRPDGPLARRRRRRDRPDGDRPAGRDDQGRARPRPDELPLLVRPADDRAGRLRLHDHPAGRRRRRRRQQRRAVLRPGRPPAPSSRSSTSTTRITTSSTGSGRSTTASARRSMLARRPRAGPRASTAAPSSAPSLLGHGDRCASSTGGSSPRAC